MFLLRNLIYWNILSFCKNLDFIKCEMKSKIKILVLKTAINPNQIVKESLIPVN